MPNETAAEHPGAHIEDAEIIAYFRLREVEFRPIDFDMAFQVVRGIDGEMRALDDALIGARGIFQGIFVDAVIVGADKRRQRNPFFEEPTDPAIFVAEGEQRLRDHALVFPEAFFHEEIGVDFEIAFAFFSHNSLLAPLPGAGVHDQALENEEYDDLRDDG